MSAARLLVVLSEHPSEWIRKGEVVDRYYNPGDRFDEVHLLLTNEDRLEPAALQRLVGRATPFVHHLPFDRRLFARTAGWRPRLLRAWAGGAVSIASTVGPALVRCHGAHLNGVCGAEIRRQLGLPLVVSLHTLPGDPAHPAPPWLWPRLEDAAIASARTHAVRAADAVIAVYESLARYADARGARRVVLAHNVLNARALRVKEGYDLGGPPQAISVGRLIEGKDPSAVVEAVARIDGLRLTIVGDGPLRPRVEELVERRGVADRIELVPSLANDDVMERIAASDVFVARNDYLGAPKAILEPMLAGLPVVVNRPPHVAELADSVVLPVAPTADGFERGLRAVLEDQALRTALGTSSRAWAVATIDPPVVEERIASLYDELLAASR